MFITIRAGRLSKIRHTGTFNLLIAQQLLECTKPQRNVNGAKCQREFFYLELVLAIINLRWNGRHVSVLSELQSTFFGQTGGPSFVIC